MTFAFIISECENYAVMQFSSILKQMGHKVHAIFDPRLFANDEVSNSRLGRLFDLRQHNIGKLKQIQPDYIGFSVYTQDYRWALDFARMIKQQMSTPIIFGGIHCVLCGDEVRQNSFIDYVCTGEGEQYITDLAEGKQPQNSYPLTNLDSLPLPDRQLFYNINPHFAKGYTISTSRGCPYTCTFCASSALNKQYNYKYLRQRSVDNVIWELVIARRKYKPASIYFTDDNLTLNKAWLKKFSVDYRHLIDLPFYCTSNPGTVSNSDLYYLKSAGCQMVGFGLQSCNETTRKTILKRYGTNDRIKEVAKVCRRIDLPFSFDHIFNIPEDTQDGSIEFYNCTRPNYINTFDLTYLPKTELTEKYGQEDRTAMYAQTNTYASIFALLPHLPKRCVMWLHTTGYYKHIKLNFTLRLLLKDLSRLKIKRFQDIYFPIQNLVVQVVRTAKIKLLDFF